MAKKSRNASCAAMNIEQLTDGIPVSNLLIKQNSIESNQEEMVSLKASEVAGLRKEKEKEEVKLDSQDTNSTTKDSNDLWENLKLPKIPCRLGARVSKLEIAEQWFNLIESPEAQDRIYLYIYRVWPKIVRPKQQKYIDKLPLRMYGYNKIVATHGGGDYKMIVTDTGSSQTLFEVLFNVDTSLYDPILSYPELDTAAKENTSYIESLKNKGVLSSEGKASMNLPNQTPTISQNENRMAEVLGDVVKQAMTLSKERTQQPTSDPNITSITSLLLEKMKQDNPSNGLAGMAELVKSLVPKQTENEGNKVVTQLLLDEVKSLRESNNSLVNKLLDMQTSKQSNESSNSLGQIEQVLNIVDKIKNRTEDEESKPAKPQSMLDKLIDKGLPMLAPVIQGLMLKGMGVNPSTQDLAALSQAVNQHQEVGNEETVEVGKQVNEPASVNPNDAQLNALVINYGGMISEKIISGVSGWEFALDLENVFGKSIWQQVIAYRPDQIVNAFKAVAPFWNKVSFKGESYILQWVIEFIEYPAYAAKNSGEEIEEEEILRDSSEETIIRGKKVQ